MLNLISKLNNVKLVYFIKHDLISIVTFKNDPLSEKWTITDFLCKHTFNFVTKLNNGKIGLVY